MEPQDTPNTPSTLGRPKLMQDGKRITLTLDAETIAKAKLLGDVNVSLGVRKALQSHAAPQAAIADNSAAQVPI